MKASLKTAVLAAVFLLSGCGKEPAFHRGQIVKTVIGGHVGQVTRIDCVPRMCFYDVRFGALEISTNTHFLSSDGPIQFAPVSLVSGMREFELTAR